MRLKNWWFKGLNSDMTKSIVHGSIQAIYIFLTEIQCTRVQYSGKENWNGLYILSNYFLFISASIFSQWNLYQYGVWTCEGVRQGGGNPKIFFSEYGYISICHLFLPGQQIKKSKKIYFCLMAGPSTPPPLLNDLGLVETKNEGI